MRVVFYLLAVSGLWFGSCKNEPKAEKVLTGDDLYRPAIHFTPDSGWMNDPNGMVYFNGVYHLFFQHYPDSTIWGPMHWGHAISKDLVHWQQQPIKLFPDSLGYIFSGSAVVDSFNTSGFGKNGRIPLVAIFTYHDPVKEKGGKRDHQHQALAYSLDEGKTWEKYPGNPVLRTPGLQDFRDPKVFWYKPAGKWVMTLAAGDRVMLYTSPDLKSWEYASSFGANAGAHGGVWECPDLFPLSYGKEEVWVLIVNINPGAPNGGSGTQYFLGGFDGKTFTPKDTLTRWLDYGPDNYAGVTWSNTGNRKIWIGWMSNWLYANVVPTVRWRSAMTLPRELFLHKQGNQLLLANRVVDEVEQAFGGKTGFAALDLNPQAVKATRLPLLDLPCRISWQQDDLQDVAFHFTNHAGDTLTVGYHRASNEYYCNRTQAGKVDFHPAFAGRHTAPRLNAGKHLRMQVYLDKASVELIADSGTTSLTSVFFARQPLQRLVVQPEK